MRVNNIFRAYLVTIQKTLPLSTAKYYNLKKACAKFAKNVNIIIIRSNLKCLFNKKTGYKLLADTIGRKIL